MWNVRFVGCFNFENINFRCFLETESVKVVVLPAFKVANSGSLEWMDLWCNIAFKTMIGHITEVPSAGMAMVLVSVLSCKVFDHLISTVAPISEKKMSPIHRCLETSKAVTECGNIFEIRRK